MGWTVGGLITLVVLLLLTQPFFLPECVSYERAGQHAARIGALVIVALLVAVWVGAVLALRRAGTGLAGRLALAVGLPVAVVVAFAIGASAMGLLVDQAAPGGDHAMCW